MASESSSQSIIQQIETAADLYEPALYELLTFYSALDTQADEMDGQFIPTTTVLDTNPRNSKIFAVGFLPPSSTVTNNSLDRSASVQAIEGGGGPDPDIGTVGGAAGIGTGTTIPVGPISTGSAEVYTQYVVMCNRLGCQPEELLKVLNSESGFQPNAVAVRDGIPVAKGLNQLTRLTAKGLGMTDDVYDSYEKLSAQEQLPWVEKYFSGRVRGKNAAQIYATNFGGFNNPDGSMYSGNAVALGYKEGAYQQKAYRDNIALDRDKKGYITPNDLARNLSPVTSTQQAAIDRARAALGMTNNNAPLTSDAQATPNWNTNGSANASEADKTTSKTANRDLNQTTLGKQFQAAQATIRKAAQAAIKRMAETPPLRLLVNPQSFRTSHEKIISDGSWGRNGPIIEHWGENQDKIEGSGKVAAFYSIDVVGGGSPDQGIGNGPGLTRTARQFSSSYQNLLSLWLIYKNNGGIWLPDYIDPSSSKRNNLSLVGSVYLYYDDILYIGSFDSMTLTETETTPYTLEYSFSFTVRATFLLDRNDDQAFNYGAPQFFQGTASPPISTGSSTSPLGSPLNTPATSNVQLAGDTSLAGSA